MGDGVKKGKRTDNSLGHLAYWMAKRCPAISDTICDKVLHKEFDKRKNHHWFTIQPFAVYRGDARHSPEQLGVKSDKVAAIVLKRIDNQADILRTVFRLVSASAEKQLTSALRHKRGERQRQTRRKQARTRKSRSKSKVFGFADIAAVEGMLREIKRFARVRNQSLRDLKRAKSNGICEGCGNDFSKVLGGKGICVLLVHHDRRQLAHYHDTGELTKEEDLAVVCANCHMLLHVNPKLAMRVAMLRKALNNQ